MNSQPFGRQPVRFTGQHFTKNRSLVYFMISEASVTRQDLVFDIGAGKGAITLPLSQVAKRVVAIERDPELSSFLKTTLGNDSNINILTMDFREMPLPGRPFKVVSSIPYGITTDIFEKLMGFGGSNFEGGTIITEWGAALKFTKASQASPRIVGWNTFYEIAIIQKISREAFHPPPTVDSALLKIERRKNPLISREQYDGYLSFVAFMLHPHGVPARQALRNVFTKTQVKRIKADAGISERALIQDLTIPQWAHCYHTMQKIVPEDNHPVMPASFRKAYYK